jgi:hypothetical protein
MWMDTPAASAVETARTSFADGTAVVGWEEMSAVGEELASFKNDAVKVAFVTDLDVVYTRTSSTLDDFSGEIARCR